jgi:hypothetical protein
VTGTEHRGEARTGNWLWALLVGAILLLMELILLAALIPSEWSERVQATELEWLQEGLGPDRTQSVVARADRWYAVLFVGPGLVDTSYRITLPSDADVEQAGALAPLAGLPIWSWVRGRLEVIWAAVRQALQRLAMIAAWWPFLAVAFAAAWGDGWVRRRIRQSGFAYASPLAHAYALRGLIAVAMLVGLALFLPVPLPVLGVPVVGAILALLAGVAVANAQKRL